MQAEISIIHPSRGRAQLAAETAARWLQRCKDPDRVEYILSLDKDDKLDEYIRAFRQLDKVNYVTHANSTAIEAINNAAKHTEGRILVVVSDDFDCLPGWDETLLLALKDESDFVAKTQDGLQPFIITLPIMDREYYNRFGYIYYPGYHHMFCDTEMTAVGNMLGRMLMLDVSFPHKHYSTGAVKKDAISIKNDATWQQGEQLYNERRKKNFELEQIVNPYPAHRL